jgi:hypothetical protein
MIEIEMAYLPGINTYRINSTLFRHFDDHVKHCQAIEKGQAEKSL